MKDKINSPISVKLFYKDTHLIRILGFDHRMEYNKCPEEYMDFLRKANILLQEGEHGIIGTEPFSHKEYVKNGEDKWYEQLDGEKQTLVQEIVNKYCENVFCVATTPSASSLSFSAIYQIVNTFDYWYNTIHPKIDKLFRTQGKTIVDLDFEDMVSLEDSKSPSTFKLFLEDLAKVQELLNQDCREVNPELKKHSAAQATADDIKKLRNEEQEFWCDKDNEDYNSMVINRNQAWCKLLNETIAQHSDEEVVQIALVCGKLHIPGLVDLLGEDNYGGFCLENS